VIEVSAIPHTGCAKFVERFGFDAMTFVNDRRQQRLRGMNARIVQPGVIRVGDKAKKLS
jgi:MOSC domain-containing protein YiiM